jgi:hypothetical protein
MLGGCLPAGHRNMLKPGSATKFTVNVRGLVDRKVGGKSRQVHIR